MHVPAAGPDLDEAHAALDQPARDEHLLALRRGAVHLADARRLLGDIEGVGRLGLHLEGHLEGLEARLELRVLLQLGRVDFVELMHEIELLPLFAAGMNWLRIFSMISSGPSCAVLIIVPWKTPGRNADWQHAVMRRLRAAGPQHDEARHILVLRAEAVDHPRAEARPRQAQRAGVHENLATSCAGMSVYIERMIAMSSTCSPSFGKTSLTSMPDLPSC